MRLVPHLQGLLSNTAAGLQGQPAGYPTAASADYLSAVKQAGGPQEPGGIPAVWPAVNGYGTAVGGQLADGAGATERVGQGDGSAHAQSRSAQAWQDARQVGSSPQPSAMAQQAAQGRVAGPAGQPASVTADGALWGVPGAAAAAAAGAGEASRSAAAAVPETAGWPLPAGGASTATPAANETAPSPPPAEQHHGQEAAVQPRSPQRTRSEVQATAGWPLPAGGASTATPAANETAPLPPPAEQYHGQEAAVQPRSPPRTRSEVQATAGWPLPDGPHQEQAERPAPAKRELFPEGTVPEGVHEEHTQQEADWVAQAQRREQAAAEQAGQQRDLGSYKLPAGDSDAERMAEQQPPEQAAVRGYPQDDGRGPAADAASGAAGPSAALVLAAGAVAAGAAGLAGAGGIGRCRGDLFELGRCQGSPQSLGGARGPLEAWAGARGPLKAWQVQGGPL